MDADLPAIAREIGVDPIIREALRRYPGLRVIRQDPWECAASFMLSAYNNIPRLTRMLDTLAEQFGQPASPAPGCPAAHRLCRPSEAALRSSLSRARPSLRSGHRARSASRRALPAIPVAGETCNPHYFPRPEILAGISERVLRNCGLGYRAPYLKAAAEKVASGQVDLEKLRGMEDEELRRALLTLPGIGEKVVECVMLFAYGRGAAFPVDVWIGRAMRGWYFRRRKVPDRKIREFAREHFGPRCGWAQQVLYCFARWHRRDS